MHIENIVSKESIELGPETPVSKRVGTFDDPSLTGVVVHGDEFEGVVTRRQLSTSHRHPDEKLGSLVWHVPRLAPNEDVRKVARLMLDSDSQLLAVFDDGELIGVVTVDAMLRAVQPFLNAATVADVCTHDRVTVDPESTVGEALHVFREHRITHRPVVKSDTAVGIRSVLSTVDRWVRD